MPCETVFERVQVEVSAAACVVGCVESKTKGFREGALPGEEYVEVGRDME